MIARPIIPHTYIKMDPSSSVKSRDREVSWEDGVAETELTEKNIDKCDGDSVDGSSEEDCQEDTVSLLVESEQTCSICSKSFNSIEYFLIHQRLHRQGKLDRQNSELEPIREVTMNPDPISCAVTVKVEKESTVESMSDVMNNVSKKNAAPIHVVANLPTSPKPGNRSGTKMRENSDDLLVEGPRVCKFCGKTFYSMDYYRIHQRVHVSEKLKHVPLKPSARLSSHYTGSKLPVISPDGNQVITVYPQTSVLSESESSTNQTKTLAARKCCVCDVCSLTFPNYRSLTLHKKVHRKGLCTVYPLYICSVCNRGFVSKSSFLNHCAFHGAKPWTCNICGMTFSKKMYLGMHKSSKHGPRKQLEHKCDECDKVFDREKDLKRHGKMHETPTEKFLQISCHCKLCGKMLPLMTTKELRIHMGVHFGEVLKCHICPEIFSESNGFKLHMDRHLGL